MFLELDSEQLILPETVKRGKMLGRGAFGYVFKAAIRTSAVRVGCDNVHNKAAAAAAYMDVALKMLQPVDPGFGARASAAQAYKAAVQK
jgi:hypothetical protein